MTFPERDVRLIVTELAITGGRVRKLIRVGELASSHKLERMRRAQIVENQAVWKRDGGFDRPEIRAEMHELTLRRLRAGF